ncbi:MAG: HAMP domain-containing histidine kinase [Spirochaetaceae bacterium]|nr:HAMP domain-containing histidine kinase [Spirochaetaceae bacterium]
MRKIFFRTFLSIMSVALIILIFIGVSMMFFYTSAKKNWIEEGFDAFSQRVATTVSSSSGEISFSKFVQITDAASIVDNRISGLLFRDIDGKIVYSLGVTQLGDKLAQRKSFRSSELTQTTKGQDLDPDKFITINVKDRVNLLNLEDNKVTLDAIDGGYGPSRSLEFPPMIKKEYISGSLEVFLRGQYAFSVDVLSYSPSTYSPIARIIRKASNWLFICFLISLLIALLLSFRISKVNQKSINIIKNALGALTKGEEQLELPHSKIEEHQEIIDSISRLDESLTLNRKNRKAWLSSITHDLNTPIASIKLLLDGMEDGVFPLSLETIRTLKKEQNDLSHKINRVVLYSSFQSPDKDITLFKIEIQYIIDDLKRANKNYSNVEFNYKDPYIYCDYSTIKLALKELLDNALAVSDSACVSFEKDGIIVTNKAKLAKNVDFFEPWERGDKSRTSGGTGLGLPIVAQIISLHHGTSLIEKDGENVKVKLKWSLPLALIAKKGKDK